MKEFIFENSIMQLLTPILSEILRYLVWLPLILLLIRWGYIITAKRERKKPFAILTSINGRDRFEIKDYETAIGRLKSSDIVLNYKFISRNHAVIAYRGEYWYIFDTASSGGVTVNGKKIRKPCVLHNGDTVGFAGLEFRFSPSPEMDVDRDIYSYKNLKERANKQKGKSGGRKSKEKAK